VRDTDDIAEAARAIEALLATYAARIDAGDFDGVADLLAEARITTVDGSVVATGREEIAALYAATTRRHADGTPRTSHVITNLIVEPDEVAHRFVARSYFTVLQASDAVPLQPIIAGRYRDVVERRADRSWVFVERCMEPRLFGDLRDHLSFDPAPRSSGS
jgi:uncharacterized protein (TIGR02246 family)